MSPCTFKIMMKRKWLSTTAGNPTTPVSVTLGHSRAAAAVQRSSALHSWRIIVIVVLQALLNGHEYWEVHVIVRGETEKTRGLFNCSTGPKNFSIQFFWYNPILYRCELYSYILRYSMRLLAPRNRIDLAEQRVVLTMWSFDLQNSCTTSVWWIDRNVTVTWRTYLWATKCLLYIFFDMFPLFVDNLVLAYYALQGACKNLEACLWGMCLLGCHPCLRGYRPPKCSWAK